jgi:hypothetical protein
VGDRRHPTSAAPTIDQTDHVELVVTTDGIVAFGISPYCVMTRGATGIPHAKPPVTTWSETLAMLLDEFTALIAPANPRTGSGASNG